MQTDLHEGDVSRCPYQSSLHAPSLKVVLVSVRSRIEITCTKMSPTCCPPVLIGFRNVFGSEAMGTAPAPGRATHSNFGSREAEFAVSRTYMPAHSQSATGLPSSSLLDTNLRGHVEDRWKYEAK